VGPICFRPFRLPVPQYPHHAPFPPPAHRTVRADFPHTALRLASLGSTRWLGLASGVTPMTSPSSLTSRVLSVTGQSSMELIGKANLRTLGLFQERAKSQAPFLHRHYPASSVLRACPPPQTAQSAPHGVLVESHDLSPLGLPVLPVDSSFTHAIAITPAGPVEIRRSLARPAAAFPIGQAGRLPHYPFRGLLGVHSRYGLRAC
jgi:hypothetical protein